MQNSETPKPPTNDSETPEPISSTALSWAALFSHWMEFARSSVGFPKDGDGARWKSSVAPVIGLQATTFSLGQVDRLPPAEHAAGLDRAELLIQGYASDLASIWGGEPMPEQVLELLQDARTALKAATLLGIEWAAPESPFESPDVLEAAHRLIESGFTGDLFAATPGTILAAGAPVAFLTPRSDAAAVPLDDLFKGLPRAISLGRQIVRQIDPTTGVPERDFLVPMASIDLPAGRPLLTPVISAGRLVGHADEQQIEAWRRSQEELRASPLPLVES